MTNIDSNSQTLTNQRGSHLTFVGRCSLAILYPEPCLREMPGWFMCVYIYKGVGEFGLRRNLEQLSQKLF